MACVDADGSLTLTGRLLLEKLVQRALSPPEMAEALEEPLFLVRGRIREMMEAELIEEADGSYQVTAKGLELI